MAKTSMAIKTTPPLLKAEREPAPPPQPPSESTAVKQKPVELENTNRSNQPTTHAPVNQRRQEPPPPHLIDSITKLRDLSSSLSVFQRRYDELQEHLNFIQTTIDAKLPQHLNTTPSPPLKQQLAIIPLTEAPSSDTAKPLAEAPSSDTAKPQTEAPSSDTAKPLVSNSEQQPNNEKSSRSELESLCEMMCSRGLRKYLVSHLLNVKRLREETPKALKCAPNPAKLVLDCFGRFFLQGSKAYTKGSPMIPAREASVLILECFLLMGCDGVQIEPAVKEEAETAAVAWRKRLVIEGGLANACEIDARGLLLFIGCFGIPASFKSVDVRDLIRMSNAREISSALRRSSVLLSRIPEIIEGMMKNKMEIEAVDVAYTFGIEDRFPPQTILTSFLRESKETWKGTRKATQGSFAAVNEANKKQLADLKSVIKCLEHHKIDPSKALPGWQVNEKILSLEKDIADLDKKIGERMLPKRKADETESSKRLKTQEIKRSRFAVHGLQQQKAAGHVDGKSAYDGLTPINLLDGGLPGQISSYSTSPSIQHGSGGGSLPENVAGSIARSGYGSMLAAGVGAGMSVGTGGVMPAGLYAGVHGGMQVDTAGQMMNHNGQPYGWRGDAALNERLVNRSFAGLPSSSGVDGLYRPSSSLEGFAGLPNPSSIGVSSRSSASDLYQFADAVLESESYHSSGSRTGSTVPAVLPAYRSSYLY